MVWSITQTLQVTILRQVLPLTLQTLASLLAAESSAHISDGLAFVQEAIFMAEFPNNLLRRMALSLSTHRVIHSSRKRRSYGLT